MSVLGINIKNLLFGTILFLLFVPMIQQIFRVFEVAPLGGAIVPKVDVDFSKEEWLTGKYQSQKEAYIKENIGFRNTAVRLYNQYQYSFFDFTNTKMIVFGKEGFLLDSCYIDSHLGRDFVGRGKIEKNMHKLGVLRDTLSSLGIDILVVLAPGKAAFYSEYIPDSFEPSRQQTTNYEVTVDELTKQNINYIDFKSWFQKMKPTAEYPLFPKTGVHWSYYGQVLVADSLLRYIGKLRNIKTPKIKINSIHTSTEMEFTDDDIEWALNLYNDIEDLEMAYPEFEIEKDKSTTSPKVLTIGDSFYGGLHHQLGISRNAFDDCQFWYYCKEVMPAIHGNIVYVENIDMESVVKQNDIIMIFSTDGGLADLGWGFIDRLYNKMIVGKTEGKKYTYEEELEIQEIIYGIQADPEWLLKVELQAKEKGIPMSKCLRENAEYVIWIKSQEN